MVAIRILTGMLLISLIGSVMLTCALSRILRLPNATWLRAIAAVLVITFVGTLALVAQAVLAGRGIGGMSLHLAFLAFSLVMPLVVYHLAYQARGWKLAAFFGLHVVLGCLAFGLALVTKAYVAEAFVINANSMAPTFYGYRVEELCPKCGGRAVKTTHSPPESDYVIDFGPEPCLHCGTPTRFNGILRDKILPPDRIVVEKLGVPRRWYLAAFRNPEDPTTTFIKRLVGLPGETITIRDGFVYADDRKLEPPPEAGELHYLTNYDEFQLGFRDPSYPDPLWGDPAKPVKLGPDEYFFLGDHTRRSFDCRFYGPIRRDAILGTASIIYWPPERWRVFK
jgi:signal peptidase I